MTILLNYKLKLEPFLSVEIIEDADKLLKLMVDVGEAEPRQIVSGIRNYFPEPQILVGSSVLYRQSRSKNNSRF